MQVGASPTAVAEVRITTLNGDTRVIFRNDANPGRQVRPAAWLDATKALLLVVDRDDGTSAIGYVPVDGGEFAPLKLLQATGRTPDPPTASPDGRFVAFADGPPARRDLYVISLDGRIADRITDHPSDDRQPRWSPDGQHVVFISSRFGGEALWSIEMRDGRPVGEPFKMRDGMNDAELIGWGGGGLAYVQPVRTDDIYTVTVDPSTGQPRTESRQLSYGRTGRAAGPSVNRRAFIRLIVSGDAFR
jgi:dipeptidyl aminopeptidase/acylaminoacyl peptidase